MLDGMTNIKASEVLKEIKYYSEDLPSYSPDEVAEALEMAIQALEQEDILEKIKAEINIMPCGITSMREIYVNRDRVINIIDKYRKGDEDDE